MLNRELSGTENMVEKDVTVFTLCFGDIALERSAIFLKLSRKIYTSSKGSKYIQVVLDQMSKSWDEKLFLK